MKSRRQLLFRAGALLIVLLIAAAMFVIGRGHTVYFDNKTIEVNGQTYEAFHKVEVFVKGEKVAKLGKRDRGMAETMGQKFEMTLEVTEEKGKDPDTYGVVTISLIMYETKKRKNKSLVGQQLAQAQKEEEAQNNG